MKSPTMFLDLSRIELPLRFTVIMMDARRMQRSRQFEHVDRRIHHRFRVAREMNDGANDCGLKNNNKCLFYKHIPHIPHIPHTHTRAHTHTHTHTHIDITYRRKTQRTRNV